MKEPYIEFSCERHSYVIYLNNKDGLTRHSLFSSPDENLVKLRLRRMLEDMSMAEEYEAWYESSFN